MADSNSKSFVARRLRTARELAGLTQSQVAKKLGLHRPSVSEMEAGRRKVSAEELARLAEIYGTTTEWLTTEVTKATSSEDKIELAARQLSKMKDEDLDRLLSLVNLLRNS